jgi:hypothetical protein
MGVLLSWWTSTLRPLDNTKRSKWIIPQISDAKTTNQQDVTGMHVAPHEGRLFE